MGEPVAHPPRQAAAARALRSNARVHSSGSDRPVSMARWYTARRVSTALLDDRGVRSAGPVASPGLVSGTRWHPRQGRGVGLLGRLHALLAQGEAVRVPRQGAWME